MKARKSWSLISCLLENCYQTYVSLIKMEENGTYSAQTIGTNICTYLENSFVVEGSVRKPILNSLMEKNLWSVCAIVRRFSGVIL